MIESSMRALEWAKKLRARRETLKRKRAESLKAYDKAFEKWKRDLGNWLAYNTRENIARITKLVAPHRAVVSVLQVGLLLDGAPKQPHRPNDDTIKKIDGVLRHLAITGQKTVRVTSDEVTQYFGDDVGDDE